MSLAEEVEQNATTVPKSATPSTKQSNHRSQCMVDMSRMTGRREKTNESPDWGKVDVMHSLQYIKGSISKNINFGKTKREKVKRVVMNNRSYDYDLSKVRPKRRGLVEFGATRGRDQHLQPDKNYSYQHYEYDSYVWQSNSSVFPNTKTHGVDFNKQTSRYKLENQHS